MARFIETIIHRRGTETAHITTFNFALPDAVHYEETLGAAYVQDSNTVHCLIKFERSEISRDIVVAEIVRACLLLEIGADHKRRANQDKDGRRANKTRLRKEGLLNN